VRIACITVGLSMNVSWILGLMRCVCFVIITEYSEQLVAYSMLFETNSDSTGWAKNRGLQLLLYI